MVVSNIDKSIDFPSVKFVDGEDLDYDAQLYEIPIFSEISVIIALGKVKYTYVDKKLLYIPVYLTDGEQVVGQIGVYEFAADMYTALLDDDNDFDISLLKSPIPLLYDFVNESYIRKMLKIKKTSVEGSEVKGNVDVEETDVEEVGSTAVKKGELTTKKSQLDNDSRVPNDMTILEELREEDDDEAPVDLKEVVDEEGKQEKKFKKHSGHKWVEVFMKNENYDIENVEANGDCLFATIREAYNGVGKSVSVAQLREIVSQSATEATFNNFKEQFDMYSRELSSLGQEMADIQLKVKTLKLQLKNEKDRDKQKNLVDLAKPLVDRFTIAKREKKLASEMFSEFKWMRGVTSLEKLKKKIKTTSFWAESWAINILELALNMKMIILSSENYNRGDTENILLCGEMVDQTIIDKGVFKPKYYIIVEHTGNHYKLITYKRKRIFKVNDIPIKLKGLIINKCMEKTAGIYNYIPKFKILKQRMISGDDATPEDQGNRLMEGKDEGLDMKVKPTFDETTIFQFYSKSSDKPLPGRGAGEKINPKNQKKFSELVALVGWRKVLSNFHMEQFKLDGKTWNSVEHYYHANKFKKGHPKFYDLFAVESGSKISKSAAFAKSAGGKTGKYKSENWKRDKKITMDEDFFSGRNQIAMEAGQQAKYSQNEIPKKVLLATKDAKLQHHVRGSPPIVFYDTMRVRERLSISKGKPKMKRLKGFTIN